MILYSNESMTTYFIVSYFDARLERHGVEHKEHRSDGILTSGEETPTGTANVQTVRELRGRKRILGYFISLEMDLPIVTLEKAQSSALTLFVELPIWNHRRRRRRHHHRLNHHQNHGQHADQHFATSNDKC